MEHRPDMLKAGFEHNLVFVANADISVSPQAQQRSTLQMLGEHTVSMPQTLIRIKKMMQQSACHAAIGIEGAPASDGEQATRTSEPSGKLATSEY